MPFLYFQRLDGNNPIANPAYKKPGKQADRLLRGWIIGTLAEEALSHVIGLDTSTQVWATLKEAYAQSSQERQFQLNQQLTYMKKTQEVPLNEYIRKFKEVCDNLAAIGHMVADKNKVFSLLTGLGARYEPFTTSMLKPPMPSYNEAHHEEWTSNTGASAHMTSNEGNLYNLRPYTGNDHVMLGNGEFLKVTHTGDALLGFGQSAIVLRNVLLVPELERSLLSIGQLTSDYSVTCEFSNDDFVIKDKLTQQVLMRGLKREDIWHQRLGHVQAAAVAHLRNKALIRTISNKDNSIFHIDLWGPAPLTSLHQFRFYAAIVDDFTKHVVFNESSLPYKNFNVLFDTAAGIQPITFREFDSWSISSCEHLDHFTQPAEEAPLPTPNAQLKTTITIGDLVSGSHSITPDNPSHSTATKHFEEPNSVVDNTISVSTIAPTSQNSGSNPHSMITRIQATIVDEDSEAIAQQYSGMIAKYGNKSVVKGLCDNSHDLVKSGEIL
ncbi:hypothetical protein Pint_32437 [Pistacia integerrima]|uniref:Uncharacterized protein n=1 Tax=Pistacia integerrima TaxID=434235 RepID=A0ACC0XQT8_9ROSI|nr:hypothetical protein Pint_32437 [Pistacia integerrima]